MDKVLTKPYLDIRYEKQDADTYPIRLRVTYKRKQYYYPTGKSLSIPDWCRMYGIPDKEGKKHGKTTEKLKGNLLELGELELKARRIIEKMTGFDFKSFRAKMDDQEATDTISSHFNRYINSLGEHSHIKTARNYESALASLEKFRPGSLLNQITTDFLKDYKDWMLGEKKSVTTLSMYARCIRTIINKAISDKEFPRDDYPFGRYRFLIPAPTKKKNPLSTKDFDKLCEYQTKNKEKAYARDMWLLCYFCGGRNYADLLHLKYKNVTDKTITFPFRQKTKETDQKPLVVKIHDDLKAIIKRWAQKNTGPDTYFLDVLNDKMTAEQMVDARSEFGKTCNEGLKAISVDLKIKQVRMQQSRHTAFSELRKAGIPDMAIKDIAGHANIRTTEIYMESLNSDTGNEALNALRPRKSKLKAV